MRNLIDTILRRMTTLPIISCPSLRRWVRRVTGTDLRAVSAFETLRNSENRKHRIECGTSGKGESNRTRCSEEKEFGCEQSRKPMAGGEGGRTELPRSGREGMSVEISMYESEDA